VRALYIIPLAALIASPAWALDLDDTTYSNPPLGLTMHAPHGWKIHRLSGYPSMLAILVSQDGHATISLTHGHLQPGQGIEAFLKGNCSAMRRVGLRVDECGPARVTGREVMRSRARSWNNATAMKQIYIKSQGHVFILTLACPAARVNSFSAKLLQVLDTTTIKKAEDTKGRDQESGRDTATKGKRVSGPGKDALPELGKGKGPPKDGPAKDGPLKDGPLEDGSLEDGPLPEVGGPSSQPTGPPPGKTGPASRPAGKAPPGIGVDKDLPELGSEPLPESGSEAEPNKRKPKKKPKKK